jgi:hypothetical protein
MAPTVIPGFSGTVIRPNEAGYDAARAIWNAMHDRRPTLIARPQSAQDVAAAIRHARRGPADRRPPQPEHQAAGQGGMSISAAEVQRRLWGTLAQFQDPQTSVVTLQNTFRWVSGRRPR